MTQVTAEEAAQQLLKGITVPPQPQITVDLQMEMAMPDVWMDTIMTIIAKDVGLSGCILKVLNSPFFGLRNKITSIQQAFSLLGITKVTNIVNSLLQLIKDLINPEGLGLEPPLGDCANLQGLASMPDSPASRAG
jgi:HD-like signal output (HDOD) protein